MDVEMHQKIDHSSHLIAEQTRECKPSWLGCNLERDWFKFVYNLGRDWFKAVGYMISNANVNNIFLILSCIYNK